METKESLKIENQLCFSLYAASRMVTKCYQPVLDALGITYPQYLVLMVLWENDAISVSVISEKLKLQSNTLTPLLKRMEEMGLLKRIRSIHDERSVTISLTTKGEALQNDAPLLQNQLVRHIGITGEEAMQIQGLLKKLLVNIDF